MCLFWTQRKIFWRKFVIRLFWGTIDFHSGKENTMEVNGAPELLCFPHSSEYLPLCSEQTHSYRFGSTWGRVNDYRIFIFGCTVPLRTHLIVACIFQKGNYEVLLLVDSVQCKKKMLVLFNNRNDRYLVARIFSVGPIWVLMHSFEDCNVLVMINNLILIIIRIQWQLAH